MKARHVVTKKTVQKSFVLQIKAQFNLASVCISHGPNFLDPTAPYIKERAFC